TFGRKDCQFVFAGDGEELEGLRVLAAEYGLDDDVTFSGWLDDTGCQEHLATADIGLDTNLQHEVTPVKGLEYMSFGVPMIAFDLRETRASAADAAEYVAPGDALALARKIDELLDDPGRRASMGAAGRRRIAEALSWEHQAERYLSVFAALGRNRGQAHATT